MIIPVLSGLFVLTLGLAVGSILNLCADRLPQGESLLSSGPSCMQCQRPLRLEECLPLIGYLIQRGRCRTCGAAIGLRSPLVELLSGGATISLWILYGPTVRTVILAIYIYLFLVIAVIDLEHRRILNSVVGPATAFALIASLAPSGPGLTKALVGGVVGFFPFLVLALLYPRGMGMGDVKLAGMIGLATGFPGIVVAVYAAILCGGLAAAFLLVSRRKGRRDPIPFGPFLAWGAVVALIWAQGGTLVWGS